MKWKKTEWKIIYDPNFIKTDNKWMNLSVNGQVYIWVYRLKRLEKCIKVNNYFYIAGYRIFILLKI